MKYFLMLLLSPGVCFGANVYQNLDISTTTGKAASRVSGAIKVAASSSTYTVFTSTIDGTTGITTTKLRVDNASTFIGSATFAGPKTGEYGVRVSSNLLAVGYITANKYYGDGSELTGVGLNTVIPSSATGHYALTAASATYLVTAPGACAAGEYISALTATGSKTCSAPAGSGDMILASTQTVSGLKTFTTNPITSFNYGTGAPTSTPTAIGNIYISTNTGSIYVGVGTAGTWNWGLVGQGNITQWTASSPAGLTSWYDANNGPAPATNGTTLTSWSDRSATANTLSTVTGTPKYTSSVQNGLPAIYFDGESFIQGTNKGDTAQPTTHFLVFKGTAWGTGAYQAIAEMHGSRQQIGKASGSTLIDAYSGTNLPGGAVTPGATTLVTAIFSNTTSSVTVNAGTTVTGAAGNNEDSNYPIIGGVETSNPFTGYVMEWLVYNAALTTAEQATVKAYLNQKWSIY